MRFVQRLLVGIALGVFSCAASSSAQSPCAGLVGDCNGDGSVRISELVLAVNIALGNAELATCPAADDQGDERVSVVELIRAVNDALEGCDCPDCDDGNACTRDACFDDLCGHSPIDCPDDANECTVEGCNPATGCSSEYVLDGTSCNGGSGECISGNCELTAATPATPTPVPGIDLIPVSARSQVPPAGGCLASYDDLPDPQNFVCVRNQGTDVSSGFDVLIAGESGSERARSETLQAGDDTCFTLPSVGGSLEVTADVADEIDESNELNNAASFDAPTPIVTLPPLCTPTPTAGDQGGLSNFDGVFDIAESSFVPESVGHGVARVILSNGVFSISVDFDFCSSLFAQGLLGANRSAELSGSMVADRRHLSIPTGTAGVDIEGETLVVTATLQPEESAATVSLRLVRPLEAPEVALETVLETTLDLGSSDVRELALPVSLTPGGSGECGPAEVRRQLGETIATIGLGKCRLSPQGRFSFRTWHKLPDEPSDTITLFGDLSVAEEPIEGDGTVDIGANCPAAIGGTWLAASAP